MPEFEFDLAPLGTISPEASEDGVYALNEEHFLQAVDNLIEFFKNGPRNQAVMESVADQLQELENTFWDCYTGYLLGSAVGAQLDVLGAIVTETRQGRADEDYRAAIRVRIKVIRSNGRAEELLSITSGMVPSASLSYREVYPAAIEITLSTLGSTTLRTVFNMLRLAKPGGVRLLVTYGGSMGAVDGNPLGGTMGAVDGNPLGFTMGGGT